MRLHYLEPLKLVSSPQRSIPFTLPVSDQKDTVVLEIVPNFTGKFPAEISRQLASSKPKIIVTLSETCRTIEAAKEIARQDCRIVTVKTSKGESIPNGTIDFTELMSTKGSFERK